MKLVNMLGIEQTMEHIVMMRARWDAHGIRITMQETSDGW